MKNDRETELGKKHDNDNNDNTKTRQHENNDDIIHTQHVFSFSLFSCFTFDSFHFFPHLHLHHISSTSLNDHHLHYHLISSNSGLQANVYQPREETPWPTSLSSPPAWFAEEKTPFALLRRAAIINHPIWRLLRRRQNGARTPERSCLNEKDLLGRSQSVHDASASDRWGVRSP